MYYFYYLAATRFGIVAFFRELTLRFKKPVINSVGTAVAQWLRCCAKNRKVAGSIPAGVTGIFH